MSEAGTSIKEQVKKFWAALPTPKRVALCAATAAVLIGVLAVALMGSQVHYAQLYTGLSTEDSASVVARLKELKIPHRVTPTGVEVPEERVHELRLELAASGLPRGGGVGFEIFDSARFGATEFEQQVNLRRALEGELSRSITTIEGVTSARVHLVLPERRLFAAKSEGASASVVVKLAPGGNFGRREVAGVVHLVSSAVPGLSKERVSLVSTDGVTLHRPSSGDEGAHGLEETRSQAAREIATNMENHVRTLLERVTGPGGADVRISVDLDEATRERTEEHYEPTRTALRSEHKSEETTTEEGASVAGVPGAQTNLPDVDDSVAARAADLGGNIFRRSHTRNWEVDRITEKISTPRGNIARVSAAVLIDGNYETRDGVPIYQPRDPEELRRLEEVVKNAIGFDAKRGDSIRVEGAKFARLEVNEPESKAFDVERHLPWVLGAVGLLTLLAMFVVFTRAVKHSQPEPLAAKLEAAVEPPALDEPAVESELPGGREGALGAAVNPALLEERRTRAVELATKDPAGAAVILTRWLSAPDPVEPTPKGQNA